MVDLYKQQYDQVRTLPDRLKAAERKVLALYRQAGRYGMDDLLVNRDFFDQAWDLTVRREQSAAADRGEESSMGLDHA